MTQGFDEWSKNQIIMIKSEAKASFEAGAASRQAEINKWVDQYSKACDDLFDCQNERDELHNQLHSKVDEINKLLDIVADKQKQIDEVLDKLSRDYYTETIDECFDILKGKNNE